MPKNGSLLFTIFQTFMSRPPKDGKPSPYFGEYPPDFFDFIDALLCLGSVQVFADRRAMLRAELDAFVARRYGLTRDELRYVLDPSDLNGVDYPSETFRILKSKDEGRFGEYRTRRLVLDAWDRLATANLGERPAEIRMEPAIPRLLRDGAWARPMPASAGDAGAMLAAILKAMAGPMPARQVRLAATFELKPRLLLPHLDPNQAAEWQRTHRRGGRSAHGQRSVIYPSC